MIQIALLIIGIIALFKKSISVTGKSELRQPKIRTFGIVTIIVVVAGIIANLIVKDTLIVEVLFWLGIITPIILAIFLREQKTKN